MTTPLLHYPARSRLKSPYGSLARQRHAAFVAPHRSIDVAPPPTRPTRRALFTGACVGAAVVGGIGLAGGSLLIAVNWLLAVQSQASDLLGAAGWAAGVTMIGVVAGGIAGGVVGAFVGAALRLIPRTQ